MAGLLIFMVAFLAYLPALQGDFVWDDDKYVSENPALTTSAGLGRIWFQPGATPQYYPLVFTSFWIEHHLWGLDTKGYHLVNLALHVASAILLWRLLRKLDVPGALFASLVFAVHPVHVESVAWITERKNVLSGFFYLAALASYLRYGGLTDRSTPDTPNPSSPRSYLLSLLLFVCALLSKTVTCSLPAAILLIIWWKRGTIRRTDVWPLVPMFGLAVAAGLVTAWMEATHVGAEGAAWEFTLSERSLIAGRALWFYLGKLLWPHPLMMFYPRWQIDAAHAWQWAFPAAAVALVAGLWLARRKIGRGPLVAVLFFGGTILPTLGFISLYMMRFSFVADHFQYLPSLGLIALLAAIVTRYAGRAARPIQVVVIGLLAALTFQQARTYRSAKVNYLDTLAKNDRAWMAHNNLGMVYRKQGRLDDAVAHLEKAIALSPDYAYARNNLAMLLIQRDPSPSAAKRAIGELREAVRLVPDYTDAHSNLAVVLAREGQTEEAIASFREAIRLAPENFKAHFNLGYLLLNVNRVDEAIASFRAARQIDPSNAQAAEQLRAAEQRRGASGPRS